jgi:hypothetical protein
MKTADAELLPEQHRGRQQQVEQYADDNAQAFLLRHRTRPPGFISHLAALTSFASSGAATRARTASGRFSACAFIAVCSASQ